MVKINLQRIYFDRDRIVDKTDGNKISHKVHTAQASFLLFRTPYKKILLNSENSIRSESCLFSCIEKSQQGEHCIEGSAMLRENTECAFPKLKTDYQSSKRKQKFFEGRHEQESRSSSVLTRVSFKNYDFRYIISDFKEAQCHLFRSPTELALFYLAYIMA